MEERDVEKRKIETLKPYRLVTSIEKMGTDDSDISYLAEKSDGQVLKITPSVKHILDLSDGNNTILEIAKHLQSTLDVNVRHEELVEILIYLQDYGLIEFDQNENSSVLEKERIGKSISPIERRKFARFFRLCGENTCNKVGRVLTPFHQKYIAFVLFPLALVVNLLVIFSNASFTTSPTSTTIMGQIMFIFVSVLIHELGHISASVHKGVIPKEAGIGVFIFIPVFYVDLNRAWRLGKYDRVHIDLAGVYFQLFFSMFLITVAPILLPNLDVFFIASTTLGLVLINLLPFMRFDGYWVLSDLMNIPNLSEKTIGYLTKVVLRGNPTNQSIDSAHQSIPRGQRVVIVAYGIFLVTYSVLLCFTMLSMLSYLLTSGLLIFYLNEIVASIVSLDLFSAAYYIMNLVPFVLFLICLLILVLPFFRFVSRKISSISHRVR